VRAPRHADGRREGSPRQIACGFLKIVAAGRDAIRSRGRCGMLEGPTIDVKADHGGRTLPRAGMSVDRSAALSLSRQCENRDTFRTLFSALRISTLN
jgi:hypothetical protein